MSMAFKPILAAQRRTFITLVFFALISITHAQSVWDGTSASSTWYGDGSATTFTISTAEELANLASRVNGGNNFANKTINLAANIELNTTTGWESNWSTWATSTPVGPKAWTPIGTNATAQQFRGTFDGNSHTVSGVYINGTSTYRGLFGYVGTNGIVKNLGITNSYIRGDQYTGGLVGYINSNGNVINSYTSGIMVVATGNNSGGLIGSNYGNVINSYTIGTSVVATTGNNIGGLIGINGSSGPGTVNNCYSTSVVNGGALNIGGLVGNNSGTISNSYYDKTISGQTDAKGDGKTTVEMQSQALVDALNFSAGLLSANEWQFNSGDYPTLKNTLATNPLDGKFANDNAGTEPNPYIINTAAHLKNLSSLASKTDFKGYYFKLGQNIAFAGGDNPLTAIGSKVKPFNGTFDGDNKTISNVLITAAPSADYQGLFGYLGTNGMLKNLGVTNSKVQGATYVGGLVGYNDGTINGSSFDGNVTGEEVVGGLVGNNAFKINTSHSTGEVNGEEYAEDVGGLAGNNSGTISNSYSTSDVTTEEGSYVGGFVGTNSGTINNSYSTGAVEGDITIGGFVGRNQATIYSSYSTGKVTAGTVMNCSAGGLVGCNYSAGKIYNSYYDKTVNSIILDSRKEGKSTADMKAALFVRELNSIAALISMNKWVSNVSINNGYPTISNELAVEDTDFLFAGGDGTVETPYLITTPTHLRNISLLVDFGKPFTGKFFKLEQNIDVGKDNPLPAIGSDTKPFNGTFDGDNKIISNLSITTAQSSSYQGLFGYINSAGTIKNLGVTSSEVKGAGYVGGLVGNLQNGAKIENSFFEGSVNGTGNMFMGGLVGFNGGTISGSHSTGTVNGKECTGGLVGGNQPGTITNSYSTSTVTGTASVGGLVGRHQNSPAIIENSYSTGAVNGTGNNIGGFVGENARPINNSYSTGAVNGTGNSVGGFVGKNTSATISNNYSTGAVNGTGNNVGGFVGENNGTNTQINSSYSIGLVTGGLLATNIGGFIGNYTSCTSCAINSGYYDKTVNSTLADPRNEGKTSADMKIQGFVDNLNLIAGLISMNKWVINSGTNDGYPTLSTEIAPVNITPFFAGGDGTEEFPYLITTPTHLKNLSWLVDLGINFKKNFIKLGNDIVLNNTENWENWDTSPPDNSWSRIGATQAKAFQGTFDGNAKVVSGIYINSTSDYIGLFGYIGSSGTVKNLGVKDSYIIGTGSYFYYAGGITGANYGGTISNSYSKVNIKAAQYAGGIAGDNYGTISNNYSTGKVNGTNNLGGLVGRNGNSTSLGGMGRIENNYSTVLVSGSSTALGGLVGVSSSSNVITNSYYNKTVNSTLTDPRSEGKTTEEMKLQATFAAWDFENIWSISGAINNGYPELKWSACSIAGGAWENGTCKMPGVFPSPNLVFNTTYTSTLTLGDLPLNEHNGYAWSEPTTTRLFANDNQSFAVTYTDPSGNYTIAYGHIVVNVAKATGQTNEAPPVFKISASNTNTHTYDLSTIALEKDDHGTLTYALGTFTNGTNILAAKPILREDGHTLNYTGTGKESGTATLEVIVKSQNYADLIVTLTFEATPKIEVTITGITAQNSVYDGKPKSGYSGTPAALPYTGALIYEYAGTGYPQSATPPTAVGEYTLRVTLPDNAPYTGEWRGVFVIAKAEETPIFSNRENPKIGRIGVQTIGNTILLSNLLKNANVEVYNLQGKLIFSSGKSSNRVNRGSDNLQIQVQTKGMYIVKIANQTLRVMVR